MLLQQPSHKSRENQATGVEHTSDASEAARLLSCHPSWKEDHSISFCSGPWPAGGQCDCSPVWSNTSKKNISKLQKVQNFACQIITGKRKFDHVTLILRELRWLPVTSFLKYTLGVLAFKCVKGLAPSYLCHRFKTRVCVHDRNTRYKNNLNIPAYTLASGQHNFYTAQ